MARLLPANVIATRTDERAPAAAVFITGPTTAAAWNSNRQKPVWFYKFRTAEQMEQKIYEFFEDEARRTAEKEKHKRAAAAPHTLKVGDILYGTWGWEQTNATFVQVVATTPHAVTVRELVQTRTEIGELYMQGYATPTPNTFRKGKDGEPKTCKAGAENTIRLESYLRLSLWDGRPVSISWYG